MILLLLLEYAELGSLYEYLRIVSIDCHQIYLWAKQIAMGKEGGRVGGREGEKGGRGEEGGRGGREGEKGGREGGRERREGEERGRDVEGEDKYCLLGMNYLHYEAPIPVIHRDLKSRNGMTLLIIIITTIMVTFNCSCHCSRSDS